MSKAITDSYKKRPFFNNRREEEAVKKYRKFCAQDQDRLYKNIFVKLIFDMGHKFISKNGKNNRGVFLDIGSGIGYHLNFENLSEKKKFICLDIDYKMLASIKDKRVKKIHGNCEKLPLKNKSVDVVIASHVLEHVSKLEKCLKEVNRVLSKDGIFLVVLPCDPGVLWNFLTRYTPSRKRLRLAGLDYDMIMRYEHINPFSFCVSMLEDHFMIKQKSYYPLLIQNHNLNLICCISLLKKI